jgi:hypothetical protein
MCSVEMSEVYTLFPDSFMKEAVMTKYDIMLDDARNPENGFAEEVEKFLEYGKTYRITIKIEESISRKGPGLR